MGDDTEFLNSIREYLENSETAADAEEPEKESREQNGHYAGQRVRGRKPEKPAHARGGQRAASARTGKKNSAVQARAERMAAAEQAEQEWESIPSGESEIEETESATEPAELYGQRAEEAEPAAVLDAVETVELYGQSSEEKEAAEPAHRRKSRGRHGWIAAVVLAVLLAALAGVLWYDVYPVARMELGGMLPAASAFSRTGNSSAYYMYAPELSLKQEGNYLLVVNSGIVPAPVLLQVRDAKAPSAEDAGTVARLGMPIAAEEAVTKVKDASGWTAEWATEPDFDTAGVQNASVLLRDSCGNSITVPVQVTVVPVAEGLLVEAGSELPEAEQFLLAQDCEVSYVSGTEKVDMDVPGSYPVVLEWNGLQCEAQIVVEDTQAPQFTTKDCVTEIGRNVAASAFVAEVQDVSTVFWSFAETPDVSKTGSVACTIVAMDSAGNCAEGIAALQVCDRVLCLEVRDEPVMRSEVLERLGSETAPDEDSEILAAGFTGTCVTELTVNGTVLTVGFDVRIPGTVQN